MNTLGAFKEIVKITKANARKLPTAGPCSAFHIEAMGKCINDAFSEGKRNRWLGYVQGVLVARGIMTLDEIKELNRKYGTR